MPRLSQWREHLNALALILPGQWFGLMAFYWMRFFAPLRPFNFQHPAPPLTLIMIGLMVCLTPFVLPKSYFVPRKFERGKFYPRLGLRWFRYFAPDGDLVNRFLRRIDPTYRVISNREALLKHIKGTYPNEKWHLSFFLAGVITAVHAFSTRQWVFGVMLTGANVCFNLLPVMHQRYKRARLRHLNR